MNWQERILERTQSSFKYRVCTDSIAKTAGTTKRSTWSKGAKRRYDRCLKKVTESRGNPHAGPSGMEKTKVTMGKLTPEVVALMKKYLTNRKPK
tara:strand:- start:3742 stop:4023 length:282 start_codon:yes stop_codon:yes gene_type:complete